jgi:sirohydrochlorin cobaltochelatase
LSRSITEALAGWLAARDTRIGEVVIRGRYVLGHYMDGVDGVDGVDVYSDPKAAREIALYDALGKYRPLKTAPTLRRGWRLALSTIAEVHEALDGFYPAMLAARLAHQQGRLAITPLRDTLNRQSGMYAITRKISDPDADALIGGFCNSGTGCLKTILWPIAPGRPVTSLPAEKFDPARASFPLLCAEGCNLLVARAREVLKQKPAP